MEHGGHDTPEAVIRRRYKAGWTNFANRHKPLLDAWVLYDNEGPAPRMLSHGKRP